MNVYFVALLVYSLVLMGLGLWMSRRVKNSSDFLVAGRTLSTGRIFATFLAANIGAGSTVGAAGLGYRFGMAAWWWVGSASIGCFVLSQFVGPRIWVLAKRHGFSTLPEFLEFRYGRSVRLTIGLLFWCGALAILAGQLIAISWILNVVIGVPKWEGCLVGGFVAVVYCTAGGMLASSFVNIFELAITMSGLLLAGPFAVHALGGWSHLHDLVSHNLGNAALARPRFSLLGAGAKQTLAWVAILFPSFLISPGLLQKVYAARDLHAVRLGVGLNSLCQAAFAFVPAVLGLCAYAALPQLANPELALPAAMRTLLPTWLGVLTLASIFSAELSATDAILFMLSTSLAVDFVKAVFNPDMSPARLLTVNRLCAVLAGLSGVLLAIQLPSVITAVAIFYGLLAVALFVPVIVGLYSSRSTTGFALASIFVAIAVTVAVLRLTHGAGVGVFSPQLIGIASAVLVNVIGYLILPPRNADLRSAAQTEAP